MKGWIKTEISYVVINKQTGTELYESPGRWWTRQIAKEYEELGVPVEVAQRTVIRRRDDGVLIRKMDQAI